MGHKFGKMCRRRLYVTFNVIYYILSQIFYKKIGCMSNIVDLTEKHVLKAGTPFAEMFFWTLEQLSLV